MLSLTPLNHQYISLLADYWQNLGQEALDAMKIDRSKLPGYEEFVKTLKKQLELPDKQKKAFALIAILNDKAIGHCNLNPVEFGNTAKMHLHMWHSKNRKHGLGEQMVKMAIPIFFERFQLQELICEPFAENKAPNRVLEKAGFRFIKRYKTIPGTINVEQEVNRWQLKIPYS